MILLEVAGRKSLESDPCLFVAIFSFLTIHQTPVFWILDLSVMKGLHPSCSSLSGSEAQLSMNKFPNSLSGLLALLRL